MKTKKKEWKDNKVIVLQPTQKKLYVNKKKTQKKNILRNNVVNIIKLLNKLVNQNLRKM